MYAFIYLGGTVAFCTILLGISFCNRSWSEYMSSNKHRFVPYEHYRHTKDLNEEFTDYQYNNNSSDSDDYSVSEVLEE